ncbi:MULTISPECIES: TraG family conjugative transposon ATPase [Bacteroidales]|uniref:TraG family conjugative transposon ATPase n=1 Tax=Bacteroidales TaxID=171549 RepID=UPI00214B884C|nr:MULTISPECIES: TraG family conjugative transposon ATPase [Bacteroidales]MCR1998056.1 TraG family conjugative transposon ATPase [Bacteroides acidifaciens]WMI44117.1 TraG family conjugative transposon ATPase [Parabacteroides distasonis]
MSWFLLNRNLTLLEPYDWKLSRTVLRGERGSNAPDLPGKAIAKEGMADYIRYLFKTVRKFYGEAVVVTQEVDDIISSPIVKESIVNNSDCKILLDQRKYLNKFSQIQSLLGLTDKEKAQILSVNMSNDPQRKYKEVWFGLGGVQSTVYATEVSLEEYMCYTTEESEKVEVEQLAEQLDGNIELAIKRLAEKKRAQSSEIPNAYGV